MPNEWPGKKSNENQNQTSQNEDWVEPDTRNTEEKLLDSIEQEKAQKEYTDRLKKGWEEKHGDNS